MAWAVQYIHLKYLFIRKIPSGERVMRKQSGFTLIEIAIVLVIIGLLLGGVLKGQEMMTNAKIKRVANDFNGISAAAFSYLDRYSFLPGDDSNANARWNAPLVSGGGNGIINGAEQPDVWEHLRASGLISGSGQADPINSFGGRIRVQNNGATLQGTVICMRNIPGKAAEILDRQIDDGVGNTGEFRQGNTAAYDLTATNLEVCKLL